jgi:hypothetical protein
MNYLEQERFFSFVKLQEKANGVSGVSEGIYKEIWMGAFKNYVPTPNMSYIFEASTSQLVDDIIARISDKTGRFAFGVKPELEDDKRYYTVHIQIPIYMADLEIIAQELDLPPCFIKTLRHYIST